MRAARRPALVTGAAIVSVLAASLPAIAAAPAFGAAAASTSAARCKPWSVSASLPSGLSCLKIGAACRKSDDRYYHRYGFHCHSGRLARLSAAEQKWRAAAVAWANAFVQDVQDQLAFLPSLVGNPDAAARAQFNEFLRVLHGCSAGLASVGRPPTRKFLRAYVSLQEGCAKIVEATNAFAIAVAQQDPDLLARANAEAGAGLAALTTGAAVALRQRP